MNPEEQHPNIEHFPETIFNDLSGRYVNGDQVISCAMLDQTFVFNFEDEENGL